MSIALSDELQELESLGTNRALTALRGSSMSFGELPAKHRASGCALEARGMAIAVPDELQKSVGLGTNRALTAVRGSSGFFLLIIARADVPWSAVWRGWRRSMDTNRCHRASGYALERCLEGFAVLDRLTVPAMTLREIHLEP